MTCDILIKNIKGLVQVRNVSKALAGKEMSVVPILSDAWLSINNGLIAGFGSMESIPSMHATEEIDASGRFVLPSFVDSHTHVVYAGSREEEFVMKIKGLSYKQIAEGGGGILNSANRLRGSSDDELFEEALTRVTEIIASGTGAIEIKSGYGLTLRDEMKMLRVARRIGRETPLTVRTTFLGAHAVPAGISKDKYIREIIEEMIPAIADSKLADYIDVFCEEGFFSEDETVQILEAGRKYGMKGRVHANQLSRSGGVQAGVRAKALSVDHLENIGDDEIALLKSSQTIATTLPGAAFFLNMNFSPARKMIDEGLPLAVASDCNPGSAPSGNMPLMMSLACIKMRMTPEEALNAVTVNTAASIELLDTVGTIHPGKKANVFLTRRMPSIAYIPYAFGTNPVEVAILNGKVISSSPDWENKTIVKQHDRIK